MSAAGMIGTGARTRPRRAGAATRWRRIALGALGVLLLAVIWELYKALGPDGGVVVGGLTILPRTTDLAMPHVWDVLIRLGQPVNSTSAALPVWQVVLTAAAFTLGVAGVGWVIGCAVGL